MGYIAVYQCMLVPYHGLNQRVGIIHNRIQTLYRELNKTLKPAYIAVNAVLALT